MQNLDKCVKKCENRKKCYSTYLEELADANAAGLISNSEPIKNYEKCLEINQCILDVEFLEQTGNRTYLNMTDKIVRERVYDGEEVAHNSCLDPREEAKSYDVNRDLVNAGRTPYQLYYMRGSNPANYACNRFLVEKVHDGDEFDEAYNCCLKASNSVCIKDKATATVDIGFSAIGSNSGGDEKVKFCNKSEKICKFGDYLLEVFPSQIGDREKYCVRTWSLCPYNFNLQKGTEQTLPFKKEVYTDGKNITVEDECFDSASNTSLSCQGHIKNFYQYNRHCTTIEEYVPLSIDKILSYPPYVDKACINFVGSSHNTIGYKSYNGYEKMFSDYKSFTAPIAECLSETIKNFLFNRAGHTKCLGNTKPDLNGNCKNGYAYIEGRNLFETENIDSPTSKLLGYLHNLIMLAVILMITLYGYEILINSGKLDRKDILMNLIKIVIVISFSASGGTISYINLLMVFLIRSQH